MKTLKTRSYLFMVITSFFFLSGNAAAQGNTGIKFEQKLSWSQIKAKAKAEGKYIFIDAFATWCGPCKEMDKNVYPTEELGNYMTKKFISIKVQIDSTNNDDEQVRAWYRDSKNIVIDYKVFGFPSFLFLSPDGLLIHRGIGFKSAREFRQMAEDALNPRKQYYTLLDGYKRGKKEYSAMPEMVKIAEELKQQDLAIQIADDYVKNHLATLNDDSLFTKENLSFIGSHLMFLNYYDRIFQLIIKKPDEANRLMESADYSQQVVSLIITRDEIYKKLWKPEGEFIYYTPQPDWKKMYATITKKYGVLYAINLIPPAQLLFYQQAANWSEYTKCVEKIIERNPPKRDGNDFLKLVGNPIGGDYDNWGLNNISWNMFLKCTDPILLKKALIWSDLSIKLAWCDLSFEELSKTRSINLHQYLDTKANLLYKLGRVQEAIKCENKAIEILHKSYEAGAASADFFAKGYISIIEKMVTSQPTWPIKKSS